LHPINVLLCASVARLTSAAPDDQVPYSFIFLLGAGVAGVDGDARFVFVFVFVA
jgi:hypothetical protein